MAVDDDTKLVEINTVEDIILGLEILGGSALLLSDRPLYEHIMRAKVQYQQGVDLRLTSDPARTFGPRSI